MALVHAILVSFKNDEAACPLMPAVCCMLCAPVPWIQEASELSVKSREGEEQGSDVAG